MSDLVIISKSEIWKRLNQLHANNHISQWVADNLYGMLDKATPSGEAVFAEYNDDETWEKIALKYAIVPIEPTEAMIDVGSAQDKVNELEFRNRKDAARLTYKAMIIEAMKASE